MYAVVLIALLPVPPKFTKVTKAQDDRQRALNAEVLRRVLRHVLQPLEDAARAGVYLECADGNQRHCYPILCAWVADHMEHVSLLNIKSNACPRCEMDPNDFGDYSVRAMPRDTSVYQAKLEIGDEEAKRFLFERGVRPLENVFWGLSHVSAYELNKPDILHTIYLGIFKHLMDWVQDFLKKHGRLQEFDDA